MTRTKNAAKKTAKVAETPAAESKAIAKEVAVKAISTEKPDKKAKKAPSPEPESDSENSESENASESESEEKKPVVAAKANGAVKKAAEVATSDSSDSPDSESSEDSDNNDSDSGIGKDASSDSDGSDSESEIGIAQPVITATKNAAATAKSAVNGAAKAVAKATESSDSESDSEDDSGSSDEDAEMKDAKADSPEDSDNSSSESEAEIPNKKRKADDREAAPVKKAKNDNQAASTVSGSKNLFVGSLSWNVDDEWLYREFEGFGEITGARVISDKETGRSKGFGYVEFANATDAAKALTVMQGKEIDGRKANIDFATPRDESAPKQKSQNRAQQYGDSQNPESDTLFVGNIAWEVDENMLGEAFGAHGTVNNVRLPTDIESGKMKGFGYVTFASVEDAKTAFEAMMGAEVGGRPLRLDYATPRAQGDAPRGGRGSRRGDRGGFDRGGRADGRAGGRGAFGDRGGRGSGRGGRGGSTNRGGFGDFKGKKMTF